MLKKAGSLIRLEITLLFVYDVEISRLTSQQVSLYLDGSVGGYLLQPYKISNPSYLTIRLGGK